MYPTAGTSSLGSVWRTAFVRRRIPVGQALGNVENMSVKAKTKDRVLAEAVHEIRKKHGGDAGHVHSSHAIKAVENEPHDPFLPIGRSNC